MSLIERTLNNILQEATAVKFLPLKNACKEALDLLESYNCPVPTHEVRQKSLNCIQIALESKRTRFQAHGISALQKLIVDDRFLSSIEPENEDYWIANQILNAVKGAPFYHENTQIEIMKVLLQLTLSQFWFANQKTVIKIAEVCLDTYSSTNQESIRVAIRATFTQTLTAFSEKIFSSQAANGTEYAEQVVDSEIDDLLGESSHPEPVSSDELDNVVTVLRFLCDELFNTATKTPGKSPVPLLLIGIHSLLVQLPTCVKKNEQFVDVLWKQLCPSLIVIIGNPVHDKPITNKSDIIDQEASGRGSGCSANAPNLDTSSRNALYSIVIELVKFVGDLRSFRPVLESVFHRMLLYPPPQHRRDALKAIKEVLGCPEKMMDYAGPTIDDSSNSTRCTDSNKLAQTNTGLLKIIIDSAQEGVHCDDVNVLTISVSCIHEFLKSIEEICRGEHLTEENMEAIMEQFPENRLPLSPKQSERIKARMQRSPERTTKSVDVQEKCEDILTISADGSVCLSESQEKKVEAVEEKNSKTESDHCNSFEKVESRTAQEYVNCLAHVLPSLLDAQCGSEMDETLRTFSSHFCAGQRLHKREEGELVFSPNADDIYLISYHVLYLHFKMKHFDCLRLDSDSTYSMTFDEFLSTKTLRGKLFHLPEKWLREVYKLVTTTDILQTDACEQKYKDSVLCTALVDLVGLEGNVHGGQFRKSYREDSGMDPSSSSTPAAEAGARFARYVLALCWDGILDILSVSLNGKSAFGLKSSVQMLLGMDGAREENVRAREAACISLEGLQRAATLACFLGLHQRCSTVFGQLAHASCMIEDYQQSSPHVERSSKVVDAIINRPKMPRLHSAHALSLDMVLNSGMEIGSHARDCWYHVFRCCLYVNRLEHIYFSRHTTTGPKVLKQEAQVDDSVEDLAPSAPVMPVPVSVVPDINISHIMGEGQDEENRNIGLNGVLNLEKTSKVICHLSQAVDCLFEDVSDKLTTKALIEFLGELCKSSEDQLAELSKVQSKEELNSTNVLLIYRLGDVMLRAIGHDRPLVHVMKCWSVVAPHLIDAAGHRDHIISKKAVSCLHESITALLGAFKELPHFYFNDFFCKPFEDLLCMELCDGDVQDQIVCSICELVEACPDEIGSGWRPLFASLRAVKIEFTASEEVNEARQRHVATVLDVFDVFINLDNVLVFSNAAVNCILCLLKYVRGPGAFEPEEDDSDDEFDPNTGYRTENLVSPALHYLQLCSNILAKMWQMPACPAIAGATIGLTNDEPRTVDPIIPDLLLNECQRVLKSELVYSKDSRPPDNEEDGDAEDAESESENTPKHSVEKISSIAQVRATCEGKRRERALSEGKIETHHLTSGIEIKYQPQTLDDIDNHTGVLHVWFMMLEGLSNAVSASPKTFQPQTVDMLFELLQGIAEDPGPPFCLHVFNHLYLPILQDWMRRSAKEKGYWQGHINNFKQCVGLTADLVVDYIKKFLPTHELMVELLLKQFLDILVECISQPVEPISRLGTSCIRHILLSGGAGFTESLWNVATRGILHAFRVSTVCLQQLIILFERHSDSFTGDFGGVKVAARKDCTVDDNERLTHLAWQVFLLECQKNAVRRGILDMDSDKSYIFLLYPPEHADSVNPDHIFARVPFRSMVVGLLSHQLLLQIVGRLILGNQGEEGEQKAFPETPKLFSSRCILTLLQCLQESYKLARQFDTRPGMKFLIQKVARATVAANLYRQTGVSMTLLVECLFKLVTCETHDVDYIRDILTSGIENLVKESVIKPYDISVNHGDMANAMISSENYGAHLEVYVKLLFETCCEICDTYVDLVSQKEQTGRADKLSQQPLFFIVAKPDELDVKLERSTSTNSDDQETIKDAEPVIETLHYSTVTIQGQPENATNENEELEKNRGNLRNRINSTGSDIVYDVATHHTLEKLMSEYKRRKLQNAMPSAHKQKRGPLSPTGLSPRDALIEKEQNESIIKDSEAHVQSLTELACTLISNMEQLDDKKFQMLLPVVMPSVSQLVRLADDARLRKALGDWLMRLGNVYQITAK